MATTTELHIAHSLLKSVLASPTLVDVIRNDPTIGPQWIDQAQFALELEPAMDRVEELEAGIRRYIANTVPCADDEWTRLGELINPYVRADGE